MLRKDHGNRMRHIFKRGLISAALVFSLLIVSSCGRPEEPAPQETIPQQQTSAEEPAPDPVEPAEEAEVVVEPLDVILDAFLTIHFGEKEVLIDREVFEAWIQEEEAGYSLDEEQVKAYVRYLANRFDTIGTEHTFTTTAGETIKVPGGNYGFWMDRESTIQKLSEAILAGEVGEFRPVYYCEGVNYGENEIGNSYVEVDLDNQHIYVYKDGELVVETDCVSGKVSSGDFTPDGTFQINYKQKDATLRGRGYASKVKYWMPFNGNIGLHDASWRKEFGSDIYLRNGSHGCVNLPSAVAAQIYDNVEQGEAVIVYGGKQSVPKQEEPLTKTYLMKQLLSEMSAEQIGALSLDQYHALLREALQVELNRRGVSMTEEQILSIITEGENPAAPPAVEGTEASVTPAPSEAAPAAEAAPPVPEGGLSAQ